MAMDLMEAAANGTGNDKDTLYLLGGVALMVFGAGSGPLQPYSSPLHVAVRRRKSRKQCDPRRGALLQTPRHVDKEHHTSLVRTGIRQARS